MRKYKIIPVRNLDVGNYYFDEEPLCPNLTVYDGIAEPRDTGLVDQYENPIFSVVEKDRIGFIDY